MKQIIKFFFSLIVLFVGGALFANAHSTKDCAQQARCHCEPQPGDNARPQKFDPEKFKRDMVAYISREAGITPDEGREFFPILFEMREKQRNLERQKGRAMKRAAEKNMNDRDCQRVLHEMAELDKKMQRIESQGLARLQKKVGARKVLKAVVAERNFGRDAFRKMTKR